MSIIIEEYMPGIPRGDTRRFKITIKDVNGNLVDPDWVKLQFEKEEAKDSPYGPFVASKESQGIHFIEFSFPPGSTLGDWTRVWTWKIGNAPGRFESLLRLEDKSEVVLTFD